ncbi:MAG: hypothetical protein H6Q90_2189 [Deltaproteobacteria bacterium]|nr:hypothetical protein [Deltaproteobacteria bacterium]
MRSIVLLTLVTAACAWVVVRHLPAGTAEAAPTIAKSQRIESISIDGVGLPIAALRATMSTKLGTIVDDATLEADRARLLAALTRRGYLAAKVAPPVVTFGGGGVYVVFDIVRGPLYHLSAVELVGPSWHDAGVVTIAAGDEALGDRLARARQAAQDTLSRHGKSVQVELILHPDPIAETVAIQLVTR